MDGTQNPQNGQNKNDTKPQLSWSQPVTPTPVNKPSQNNNQNTQKNESKKNTSSSNTAPANHTFRNAAITIVLLAVVGGVAAAIISNSNKKDADGTASTVVTSTNTTATTSIGATSSNGALSVTSPQAAGIHVDIATASVSEPTWVVVYESRNGAISNILGAALFFKGQTSGSVELLRGTMTGQTYFVGEARDDGDHKFSLVKDSPVLDTNGNPLLVQFQTN
ncbi:MAG TPA: hypothetical protein VG984_02955 [Candidatus Paceibacterota bacterium]|nr:hypothetical protein [Candidatus Paceibacterota bacterium]